MRRYAIDEAQAEYNLAAGALLEAKEYVVKTAEAWAGGFASADALHSAVRGVRQTRSALLEKKKHLESLPRPETKG